MPAVDPRLYSVSWNLTKRCNLECAHCYMSALRGAPDAGELSTEGCFRVIGEIAEVNPEVFLILTGGEPLLRRDLFEIAARARETGFTVVLGTNGVLLREETARRMREAGIAGASVSLDSVDAEKHDGFRRLPGSWRGAVRGTQALRAEGLDFSIHATVTSWNVEEIPRMVDLARDLGAKVLNFFFLVRTGRGEGLTDISPEQYERVLRYLARVQGAGGAPSSEERCFDDPWSVPVGRPEGLLVRAKCAPHFRRVIWELDPTSPLLANYANGSCPAGKHYCRITPVGDVTPCPYMPLAAGNLRRSSFGEIWRRGEAMRDLREGDLGGRCGACEFRRICGGCRCRALAVHGNALAEDPGCAYEPGTHGGRVVELPEEATFGFEPRRTLAWTEEAKERLRALPSFARGMVAAGVERYARGRGIEVVTPEVMAAVRAAAEERFGRKFRFREFTGGTPDRS